MSDPNCIFCKIIAGQIPAEKIYEDDVCLAFLDIGPLAEGHVLLIPREHAATIAAMNTEQAGAMLSKLPPLARAVQAATGCEGLNVLQNNGKAAHQEVMHVHFHLIPRRQGDAFHFNWPAGKYPDGRMAALAAQMRDAMV